MAALKRYEILDTQPEGPFDRITALVRNALNVPMAAVSLMDGDRQWFKSRQGLDVCETARDISFCTHTIGGRDPMIVRDARQDDRFRDNPLVLGEPHVKSYLGAPLMSPDGYNIGALCAIDVVPRDFDPAQVSLVSQLAGVVVDTIELRRLAERDFLTGAYTRAAFINEMEREVERYVRYGRPSAIALLDIDHFKSINDTYGHPAGDQVLKAVADCCRTEMRLADVFGRIGGEEFGLLLPETSSDDAMLAIERLRTALPKVGFPFAPGLHVTASFGIASVDHEGPSVGEWIARADMGLYSAKRGGRNQSCLATMATTH